MTEKIDLYEALIAEIAAIRKRLFEGTSEDFEQDRKDLESLETHRRAFDNILRAKVEEKRKGKKHDR